MPLAALYPIAEHPLRSGKYKGLATDADRAAYNILAELLLGLSAPAYADEDGERLVFAVVLQVNFLLERGIEPTVMVEVGNQKNGLNTEYRDRMISPEAAAIVAQVTGRTQVGFSAPGSAGARWAP